MSALSSEKRITQETFDEVVRENMDEFEMEKQQALEDAVSQFKTQGVDLTNIDTTGLDRTNQRKATAAALEALKAAVTAKEGSPDEAICRQALRDLAAACVNEKPNPTEDDEDYDGPVRMEKNVRQQMFARNGEQLL